MHVRCCGVLAIAIALVDCQGTVIRGGSGGQASGTTTSNNASTSGGPTSAGPGASASGSSTSAASSAGSSAGTSAASSSGGGTSSGATSTGGSTTGAPAPPLIDGGFVSCSSDGASWMCRPGTYICEPSADGGSCFQCLSDSDCANPALPTYDPRRQHCDLQSGVPGYQNFCQECLTNADCATSPAGPYCDLHPAGPYTFYVPIDLTGFEACAEIETDCRLDGGPDCAITAGETCEPDSGLCVARSLECASDSDCAGDLTYLQFWGISAASYCADGTCSPCSDAGSCPTFAPGATCDTESFCYCSADGGGQCAGSWPVCEYPDGGIEGTPPYTVGICGCDKTEQCGDGGLICIPASVSYSDYVVGFCGPSCTSPGAPSCASRNPRQPICDQTAGYCVACFSDEQCAADPNSGGGLCEQSVRSCYCLGDNDCPAGKTCQHLVPGESGTSFEGVCEAALPCTHGACGYPGFCDWQTRECTSGYEQCIDDLDCGPGYCCNGGLCGDCSRGDCTEDCASSLAGSVCHSGGWSGPGSCGCDSASDCSYAKSSCVVVGDAGVCVALCGSSLACPKGEYCDSSSLCRPRCGGDAGGCNSPDGICDTGDVVGLNGGPAGLPGDAWCYGCRNADDCPPGLGCRADTGYFCHACIQDADCRSGELCQSGTCRSSCASGPCPASQVCDSQNLADGGANVCYACLTALDCAPEQGCNSETHVCGSCLGPSSYGGPYDCAAGEICSNYWWPYGPYYPNRFPGVCLQDCDGRPCATGQKCEVIGPLSPDHRYCVECSKDSDCGAGMACDLLSFTCTGSK